MASGWAKTWRRFTASAGYLNLANRAIARGELSTAVDLARHHRLDKTVAGRRILCNLVGLLIDKSREQIAMGQCVQAWYSLSSAAEVALRQDRDRVSRETTELVELTIDLAESSLVGGKLAQALKIANELYDRQIQDWRADRIRIAAGKIRDAEAAAAEGDCESALSELGEAKSLRPDLSIIDARVNMYELRKQQIKQLTDQLRKSLINSHWADVSRICRQLLVIAPNYEVALNAQRRMMDVRKKKTTAGIRKTSYETASGANSDSLEQSGEQRGLQNTSDRSMDNLSTEKANDECVRANSAHDTSFMLWVDGVGGFLVCPARLNTIGQAITHSNVQIPILGDIQRRHCRIETVNQDHMLRPLGNVFVDGKKTTAPTPLKNRQLIEFGGGVNLRYSQPHPLSGSAKLEFHSRHRTQPWSDSVLLASGPIILGPSQRNHVFCPRWARDLIIFRRDGKWYAQTQGKLEIDGREYDSEGPLQLDSRIVGEEFAMSLEPVTH